MDTSKLVSISQAAKLLGLCRQRVHHFVCDGRLSVAWVSPSGHRFLDRAAVARFAKRDRPDGNPAFQKKKSRRKS